MAFEQRIAATTPSSPVRVGEFKSRSALSTTPNKWQREYLPGYTGHVPTKNDFCGKTAGSINREICLAGGRQDVIDQFEMTRHTTNKMYLPAQKDINTDVFGTGSRYAKNWVNGPTHEMRQQHIPNYTGHCRGMVNKDFMSKSYAKVTAELFSRGHPMGTDTDPNNRFTSTQRFAYKPTNFRRWVEKPEMIPQKDYSDFSKFVNDQQHDRKSFMLNRTVRNQSTALAESNEKKTLLTQTNGFFASGKPRTLSVDYKQSAAPVSALAQTQVKPKLLESKISGNDRFFNLTDGFKRVFTDDLKDQKMVIPVCGYGGHRRGDRSQNFFGKSFRDTAIQSKFLEREMKPIKKA